MNLFDEVLQRVSDGILAVDTAWCCTYLNPKASELVGKSPEELLGRNIWEVFPEGIDSAAYPALHQAMSEQRLVQFEHYFPPLGRWIEHRIYPDSTGLTIYFTDISQRKQVEADLRSLNTALETRVQQRTAELAQINQELEAFSYSVSHDLRAPLRGIIGFTAILAMELGDTIGPTAQASLQTIQAQAQQMRQMIDALLEFARLGRQPLQTQSVHPNQLITEAITDLQSEVGDRAITYSIADLPSCDADPILLRQVWVNLISNAIKYTRHQPHAQIVISAQAPIDATQPLIYRISDNGIGFDMRYVDRLFGVFQRLHHQREFEGTGVGLALAQRIVQRHGGRIWAESDGHGATFRFTLAEN